MIPALCALLALAGPPASPRPTLYTNDDLARVRPFAAETGGASQPAVAPAPAGGDADPAPGRGAARGEDYWRREKQRTAVKVDALARQADTLRAQIAARERESGARTLSDAHLGALQQRLRDVEARARALEAALEERARRAGALPGWLR